MSSLNTSDGVEAIQELKAAVLALEWEISDKVLDTLLGSLEPLREKWAGQKVFLVCLQVIGTLGGYIKAVKEKAHPDATKLLHSVFDTLNLIVTDDTLSDKEKTGKVRVEIAKYNELKAEIAKKPAAAKKDVVEEPTDSSGTIKKLMEDKDNGGEEPFDALYQEMVKGGQKKPAAPSPAAMPSTQKTAGADEKEVLLDRIDDEAFPEADQLIDDFFADGDDLEFSATDEESVEVKAEEDEEIVEFNLTRDTDEEEAVQEAAADEAPAVGEAAEEDEEIIEFNLENATDEGDFSQDAAADEEFRSKIEAEIADRLDFGDEAQEEEVGLTVEAEAEAGVEAEAEVEAPVLEETQEEPDIPQALSSDLDAIIDSFASELAAALTVEIKKRVLEEIEQLNSELSDKEDDAVTE